MTRKELVGRLRKCNLLTLSKSELDSVCQRLGISARGEPEELQERIYRCIWSSKED